MKNTLSILGIAGILCLFPSCKKENPEPVVEAKTRQVDTASLYVLINSKACATLQTEYTSATLDIRGIKVFSAEHGWQELTPVAGAWDLVSLQSATVPVAEITENTKVKAGAITKIMLTFGTNNQLVVDNQAATCYKIGVKEVTIDFEGEIKAGALNEIVLNVDICGNFSVETRYQEDPCYTLTPMIEFQGIVQR